jgi:long-chain acyl-CoA synthetase
VEGVLNGHPDIRQSAVVGRPAGDGNEEIVAFVEPVPGTAPTEADLADYAARRLAPYKQPSRIVIMADLPMTAAGKIAKRDIAAMALEAR